MIEEAGDLEQGAGTATLEREPAEREPAYEDGQVAGDGHEAETEKRLKDKDAFITRLETENRSMRDQLAELKGRVDELGRAPQAPEETPPDPWDLDEERRTEFAEDPAKIVDYMKDVFAGWQSTFTKNVLDVLQMQDSTYRQQFTDISGKLERVSPEFAPWSQAVAELKKKEVFKDLPDAKLVGIAKEMGMKPSYEYRGGPSIQRPRDTQSRTDPRERAEARQRFLYLSGGDEEKAERMTRKLFGEPEPTPKKGGGNGQA